MGTKKSTSGETIGSVPRCQRCDSERVVKAAAACWNPDSGLWELERVLELAHCYQCAAKTTLAWSPADIPPRLRIRELNDRFRTTGAGNGSVLITSGIRDGGPDFVQTVHEAVRSFDSFGQDNDPWGEHDFGALTINGQQVFWKLDYYALDLKAGSENPANEGVTHRVLTIMLASEY